MTDTIWYNTLDGIWGCRVTRVSESEGLLEISQLPTGNVVHQTKVGLLYGAAFGPDCEDVRDWQDICTAWVDTRATKSE